MQHRKRDAFAFGRAEHDNFLAADLDVRAPEVQQRGHERKTGRIDEVAVVSEDVQIRANVKALLAGNQAEGLGVQGITAANSLLQESTQ